MKIGNGALKRASLVNGGLAQSPLKADSPRKLRVQIADFGRERSNESPSKSGSPSKRFNKKTSFWTDEITPTNSTKEINAWKPPSKPLCAEQLALLDSVNMKLTQDGKPPGVGFDPYTFLIQKVLTGGKNVVADSLGAADSKEDASEVLILQKIQPKIVNRSRKRDVARKLLFENHRLKPANPQDKEMLDQALKEKYPSGDINSVKKLFNGNQIKQPVTSLSSQELLKRGATKPPRNVQEDLVNSLLSSVSKSKDQLGGIGNATMGMQFKSIYLAQGRTKNKGILRNNDLSSTHRILLHLNQREEQKEQDFFQEDLYSSAKFHKDQILDERLFQVRYNQDQGVKNQLPLNRSILGQPEQLLEQKKQIKKRAILAIRADRKERKLLAKQRKEEKQLKTMTKSEQSEDEKKQDNGLNRLKKLNVLIGDMQLYPQNQNSIKQSQQIDLTHVGFYANKTLKLERQKSQDSMKSSITFLDEDEKVKKRGGQNTLDNVSEQQDLEDLNEVVIKVDNKKLRVAETHEQRQFEWKKLIEKLKDKRKQKSKPALMERQLPKPHDQEPELKFMISRLSTNKLQYQFAEEKCNTGRSSLLFLPQNQFTEPNSPLMSERGGPAQRTESINQKINFFQQSLRDSHVSLLHTNPKSYRQDLVCTQPASRLQKSLVSQLSGRCRVQTACVTQNSSFHYQNSDPQMFAASSASNIKFQYNLPGNALEESSIDQESNSNATSIIQAKNETAPSIQQSKRVQSAGGFISSFRMNELNKNKNLYSGIQFVSKKKQEYKTEGQFIPMMVYLKNNAAREVTFDGT